MSYKTILVHVDNSKQCAARIDLAARLADEFEAHLTGLYVSYIAKLRDYPFEGSLAPIASTMLHDADVYEKKAATLFDERIQCAGLSKTEWRRADGYVEDAIQLNARYADLVVVGQPDFGESALATPLDFPALLALAIPRPILVVPNAGTFTRIGHNVLVAWNGSGEATRAVTNALPLLRRAEKVTVLAVNPVHGKTTHGEIPCADIALYLARHGVKAEAVYEENIQTDIGNWLLACAADYDSDLIVLGAYGHFRLRELVLGGVTQTLMRKMTVPLLLSH
ncbi:MAG TPA: universal stress protein [Burkholderiales bacterium]|jgi:nucleotide-binding universal stress UspA family protein|nr:universal stress protein [Burkholderiales bacterium]